MSSSTIMSLPSSLPKNWPNPTPEELAAKPQRIVIVGGDQHYSFCDNSIKTSKYELWNFLPKFLCEEFNPKTKFANCYFLVICALQIIPQITNTSQYPTTLIPLLGVLIISGILKALEDLERHKADKAANSSDTEIFDRNSNAFYHAKWSDIKVGDFIRIKSRTIIPADVIVFQTWEPNPELPKGVCYVETKSLDGETNLKFRSSLPCLLGKITSLDFLSKLKGTITMEHPNPFIDNFTGVLESAEFGKVPILPNNVILRGCVLRSTEFMIGIVVNTGHDVKIMQSKIQNKAKSSKLERVATKRLIEVILLLLFLCLCVSFGQYGFNSYWDIKSFWYLNWTQSSGTTFVIKFFYTLLLHASFVPVALYVSMALVRFGQSYFMNQDLDMYYEEKGVRANVRTMNLNEELGQISHIFSDKTGTLTSNNMKFRKASINGVSYGKGITEIGKAAWKLQGKTIPPEMLEAEEYAAKNAVPHVSFYCPDFDKDFLEALDDTAKYTRPGKQVDAARTQRDYIKDFYRYLAVCHEIIPERLESGEIKLSANSPDDEALVCAAGFFGYEFKDRRDRFAIIFDKESSHLLEVEVLYTIPFTSARKRMSVIIRDIDHKIKIITKGADTIILARSDPNDVDIIKKTTDHIQQFSVEGLRCLMVAVAIIDEENFRGWSKHYDEANTDLSELEKKKRGEQNDIETLEDLIERGLHVVGATAIEDKLQEGVPECIETLLQAGMKIWILTGDKEETAINIGVACSLLQPNDFMDYVIINRVVASDPRKAAYILRKEIARYMRDSVKEPQQQAEKSDQDSKNFQQDFDHLIYGLDDIQPLKAGSKPRALIIDGPSLIPMMKDTKLRNLFLLFSQCCQSVICCRVSPDQKREVVDLIKHNVDCRTLAIGDGANDVAMITSAHIGVGIKGEEGVQAVNAADYSIGRFRFLAPLILKHGRYNYIRLSNLISFMLYKNIFMSCTMYWYNFYNAFSGLKFFTEGGIQFYNLFYTSFPIVLYSIYDQDLHPQTVFHYPQLFLSCQADKYFNFAIVWQWIFHALGESVLCCILPLMFMKNFDYTDGTFSSYVECGALSFTAIVIVVNAKMLFFQRNWTFVHILVCLLSIGFWILVAYGVNVVLYIDFNFYWAWNRLLSSGVFWLTLLIVVGLIILKDLFFASVNRFFFYIPEHILQEMEQIDPPSHQPLTVEDENPDSRSNQIELVNTSASP